MPLTNNNYLFPWVTKFPTSSKKLTGENRDLWLHFVASNSSWDISAKPFSSKSRTNNQQTIGFGTIKGNNIEIWFQGKSSIFNDIFYKKSVYLRWEFFFSTGTLFEQSLLRTIKYILITTQQIINKSTHSTEQSFKQI